MYETNIINFCEKYSEQFDNNTFTFELFMFSWLTLQVLMYFV